MVIAAVFPNESGPHFFFTVCVPHVPAMVFFRMFTTSSMQTLQTTNTGGEGNTTFYFVPREKFLSMGRLLTWNTLKSALVPENWSWQDVLAPSEDALARHVVISHRWVTQNSADPSGTQCEVIKKYLEDHPDVEKVWADVCCLPQGRRSNAEEAYFRSTLKSVNILYVGFAVCFLLDASVVSRFWCVLEYFLGTRIILETRIEASTKRMHLVYVHGDDEKDVGLKTLLQNTMGRNLDACLAHLNREEKPRGLVLCTEHSEPEVDLGRTSNRNSKHRSHLEPIAVWNVSELKNVKALRETARGTACEHCVERANSYSRNL